MKMKRYILDAKARNLLVLGFCSKYLNDEAYLKRLYRLRVGKELNLNNPKTYTEKVQWLKLYDRRPIYTVMQDKYLVKDYISKVIGKEYVIPLLGVWNSADEIDFDSLPEQFVLKCNHDYSSVIICRDKSSFDISKAKEKLSKQLKKDFWLGERQWAYKHIPHKIIAEKYMEDNNEKVLTDYKFFCFNGEPKIMYCSKDKADQPYTDFFDMDYNRLNIRSRDPNSDVPPEKPKQFEKMKELAHVLSEGYPHIRVDFYVINGQIYFGELTMYHNSGLIPFKPQEWEEKMGDWLILPQKTINR